MWAKGAALIQQADRLLCESWNERMWSHGEPAAHLRPLRTPSPSGSSEKLNSSPNVVSNTLQNPFEDDAASGVDPWRQRAFDRHDRLPADARTLRQIRLIYAGEFARQPDHLRRQQ